MKNLTGKTALITGGAFWYRSRNRSTFSGMGMKIALADIETPILEEAVSELKELNYEAIGIQCDERSGFYERYEKSNCRDFWKS